MDDEMLLETNQQKLLTQLSVFESDRRFGSPDNPDFQVGTCAAINDGVFYQY